MTIDELIAHTHSMSAFVVQHQFQNGPNDWSGEHPDTVQTGSTGGSQPFNVMQPSLVVNGFIKT
ncbi:hypothetical protein [Rickettsiella massiliensis]|uniref:hypothetical protein n=1 Tax=Rickettsiella massiliensis TaxID=676517 RepID=UPI000299E143|nr:hypothetical protein [Rickettsiella massiliensis]